MKQGIRYFDKALTLMATDESSYKFISQKLRPEFFGEQASIYKFIVNHFTDYGSLPTIEQIKTEFDEFQPEDNLVNLDFLVEKVINTHKEVKFQKIVSKTIEKAAKTNITDALANLVGEVNDLNSISSKESILRIKSQDAISFVNTSDMSSRCCNWNLPMLDQILKGVYNTDYNILVARPKVGKTHISRWLCAEWWKQGKTPLLITLENGRDVTLRSIYAYLGGLGQHISITKPNKDEEAVLKTVQAKIDSAPNDLIIVDTLPTPTIEGVFAVIERYNPDIVILDQLTLVSGMNDKDADWAAKTKISRSIKQFIQRKKIPFFALTQASRAADQEEGGLAKTNQIGYTDAYLQDCDNLFALGRIKDSHDRRLLSVLESRRAPERIILELGWELGRSKITEIGETITSMPGM